MTPVSLKRNDFAPPFSPSVSDQFPRLWLEGLKGTDIPEEGEIRFRYSRLSKVEREDRQGESLSVELCLKTITDICDCKGRDAKNNEPDDDDSETATGDTDSVLDDLMEELEDEDMTDESEDDNPDKY